MRDLFNTNPYGRYDMGRFSAPAFARPVKMGCELHADYSDLVDYPEEDHEEDLDQKTLACKKCAKKHRRTNGRLGSRMGDDLLDSAKSVFDGLLGTFAELVKDLPPQAAGVYQDRLKTCQNMVGANPNTGTYVAAAACLRSLYEDMKAGKGVTPATPLMTMQPQSSSFPVVPVAIAVVGGLAIFYVMSTMKKKPGKKST